MKLAAVFLPGIYCSDVNCRSGLRTGYLGYAGGTEPIALRDRGDFGSMAVCVTSFVTAITEQEEFLIIPLPANLAVLQHT